MKQAKPKTDKASFNLQPDVIKKLKYIAWKEEKTQTQVLSDLLNKRIEEFEKDNGPISID